MGVLSVVKDYGTELLNAVRDNDLKTFKSICEKHLKHDSQIADLCKMDIKHKPSRKFACPLILASRSEDPSILKYMMEIGTNPNSIHQSVYTTRKMEIVTPLHIAVDLGLVQTVEILLNFNADPNIPDQNEDTPFIIAVKKSDWTLMKMMLSKGGNPSITDMKGNAPLHMATLNGHLQMVRTLLKNNADMHQKGFAGAIPSHIAAKEGHIHLVQVFCSADPGLINAKIPCFADRREKAMVHLAGERGHAETVVALIDQFSADVNLRDSQGNTPLHCVVLRLYQPNKMRDKDYFYATAKILLKYKAVTNERNNDGQTALHLAARHNHPKIVELLLNVGANAFAEDNNRMKPVDVVPDSDTVSKQLLKSAMLNPKPPINASSLSLVQNSSFHIGQPSNIIANKNSFITKSMLENSGSSSMMKAKNGIFMDSSMSSILANNVKQHHSSMSPKSRRKQIESGNRSHDNYNNHYSKHDRSYKYPEHLHSHRKRPSKTRSQSSESTVRSVFSYGPRESDRNGFNYYGYSSDDEDSFVYKRSDSRTKRSDIRHRKSDSKHRRTDSRHRRSESQDRSSDSRRPDSSSRKLKSGRIDYSPEKRGIKGSRKHEKHKSRGNLSESIYSDEDGVRIHTFPGKPSTIEVEYMRGPIIIELENQEQADQQPDMNKTKPKKHKRRKKTKPASPEESQESLSDSNNKESLNDWFNEMTKYNKNQRKKRLKSKDEDEYEVDSPLENKIQLNKVFSIQQSKKQLEKAKQKQSKQKQYEEQLEMEKLPIVDPEPPVERLKMVVEDSLTDESSFDSESFEEKINDTQKVLNDSASRRILEVMRSVQSKWSQDEGEEEDIKVVKKSTKEYGHQMQRNPQKSQRNVNAVASNKDKKDPKQPNFEFNKNVYYHSNFVETPKDEIMKMETICFTKVDEDESLSETIDDDETSSVFSKVENKSPKKGLNMRIAGETPKAYTRKGKASARAKFILSAPAKIESSSEASDNEHGFTDASIKRRAEWGRPLTPGHTSPPAVKTLSRDSSVTKLSSEKGLSYAKPYKTFGKIQTKTDALEEALKDDEDDDSDDEIKILDVSTNTDTSSNQSPVGSKIIPERYQIKKHEKFTNVDHNSEESPLSENSKESPFMLSVPEKANKRSNSEQNETKLFTQKLKTSKSIEDVLEIYAEEPIFRKRKNISGANKEVNLQNSVQSEEDQEVDDREARKNMYIRKFPLPEGFSPEVWEEASQNSPLASSDTYAIITRKKKIKGRSTQKKSSTSPLYETNLDEQSLDVCVPLDSENGDQSQYTDDSLNVCIPPNPIDDDKRGEKGNRKRKETIIDMERQEVITQKHQLKRPTKDYLIQYDKREPKPLCQSFKLKKPPKPIVIPQKTKPFVVDEMESSKEVEDLNELPYTKKLKVPLPKHPNRPYDIYRTSAYSDTEVNTQSPMTHKYNYIHSEAEASDYEPPTDPKPGMSYKQAALNSINSTMLKHHYRTFLLRQPGHHDKNFDYVRKLYHPRRRRRVRTGHLFPSAGKYGTKELKRVLSNQSFTESESEIDHNRSFITDDEYDERSEHSLTSRQDKKISPIYESLVRFKKLKQMRLELKEKETEPIGSLEPEGVNFERYNAIARLWMEQVDRETVLKSKMMYFTILPEGHELPRLLIKNDALTSRNLNQSGDILPQWVVARSRFIQNKASKDPLLSGASEYGHSETSRHLILFFKIGIDWMELAWVLFDGLLKESEIVRMIKDIQIKNPSSLSDQVSDLMQRWWQRKRGGATIQELQKALDLIQMFYIHEEIVNKGDKTSTFIRYPETEDDLDTGEVTTDDPNVSRLCQEYNTRSLNSSFVSHSVKSLKHVEEFGSDHVLRKLQTAQTVPTGMNEVLARVTRPSSRNESHDVSSLERSPSAAYKENVDFQNVALDISHHIVEPVKRRKKKQCNFETNL